MQDHYAIRDKAAIFSPALIFYKDLIQRNLTKILAMAGSPLRLRPHAKTHKTREIARMELDAGITKHKCATIAEAELLAQVGAPDVKGRFIQQNRGRITTEGELVLDSQRFRDQAKNIDDCLEKLREMVVRALYVPKKRRPTKPSRGSKERRLEAKRHLSRQKAGRRRPEMD